MGVIRAYYGEYRIECGGAVVIAGRGKHVRALVRHPDLAPKLRLVALRRSMPIEAAGEIAVLGKPTYKRSEAVYNINVALDPASYPTSRDRQEALLKPRNRLARGDLTASLAPAEDDSIQRLYEAWLAWKLAQPTTYFQMFPRARYRRCCSPAPGRHLYVLRRGVEAVAVESIAVEGRVAYGLALIRRPDAPPYSVQAIRVFALEHLRDSAVEWLNVGDATASGAGVRAFKEKWPHELVENHVWSALQ